MAGMTDPVAIDPAFDRCYCTGVTRAVVERAVREHGCRTVEEVRERTGACSGCRTCRPELERLLRDLHFR